MKFTLTAMKYIYVPMKLILAVMKQLNQLQRKARKHSDAIAEVMGSILGAMLHQLSYEAMSYQFIPVTL